MIKDQYQMLIYKMSYARWNNKENRREEWNETVDRYRNYMINIIKDDKYKEEFNKACDMIMKLEIMPSMRALWTAGEALDRDNLAAYNCSYVTISNKKVFSEILYILMCGTGVGFSIEKKEVEQLPQLPDSFEEIDKTLIFSDSKIGWAEGYDKYIKLLFRGKIPKYDLSRLRKEGAILKTFGGRASGPVPLKSLLENTKIIITEAKGRKLLPIECYDIVCHIASAIVSGGVRRSACISLSDLEDDRVAKAKIGEFWHTNPQRILSNNSVVYTEKPSSRKFMSEWIKLIESKCGERGIFNRTAAKYSAAKTGRRDPDYDFGGNPCQPEWATVLTKEGIRQIKDINVGNSIWSEDGWVKIINKENSGIKRVFKWRTNAGIFYGTKDHKVVSEGIKVKVRDAESIDILRGVSKEDSYELLSNVIMDGLILGDGSVHKASNNLIFLNIGKNDHDYFDSEIKSLIKKHRPGLTEEAYEIYTDITYNELPYTYDRSVPDRFKFGGSAIVKSFLRGIFSANGSVIISKNRGRVTLKTSSEKLVDDVQLMLSSIGIKSYKTENKKHKVEFRNGVYECKKSWDINITTDTIVFYNKIGFIQKYKMEKIERILNKKGKSKYSRLSDKISFDINEIEYISTEPVYNLTVDGKSHTYWTGGCNVANCMEVILRPNSFCNLSEAILRSEDSREELIKKVKYATVLACVQSTLTNFNFIGNKYRQNCIDERLLGVSLTGLMDHPKLNSVNKTSKKLLRDMKEEAIETAEEWARTLEIKMPAAITCVKPSGTVSQLTNCSSGVHTRYSKYYIRRVRVNRFDPIAKLLIESNIKYNPEVGTDMKSATTIVFDFYIKSPKFSATRDEMTALQQLEYWKMLKECWCEHNPSCTIYIKESEWISVAAWVYENWNNICGLSFLPYDSGAYQLAPYEEIDEETYNNLIGENAIINFNELSKYEKEDSTVGAKELACSAGGCNI